MKQLKRNDGYVLPYVLVVFLVLSFVAVTICGMSLNNLRTQEEAVEHTQTLYETEGLLERFVAELAVQEVATTEVILDANEVQELARRDFRANALNLAEALEPVAGMDLLSAEWAADVDCVTVTAKSKDGNILIKAELTVDLDLQALPIDDLYQGYCAVKTNGLRYTGYDISRPILAEGGEGA